MKSRGTGSGTTLDQTARNSVLVVVSMTALTVVGLVVASGCASHKVLGSTCSTMAISTAA